MRLLIDTLKLDQIGGWKFLNKLGDGKASATLLYKNHKGEKAVVKMLIAPRNNMEIENMRNEVSALSQLNSLLRCYVPRLLMDFRKLESYPISYYMMEYVPGIELKKIFENEKLPWSWEKSTELICRVAFALSQGSPLFVHRDLHPGNILILDKVKFDRYSSEYNIQNPELEFLITVAQRIFSKVFLVIGMKINLGIRV
jgi:serine/threonine protein kinase